jgi:hypothetical protein
LYVDNQTATAFSHNTSRHVRSGLAFCVGIVASLPQAH